MDFLRNLQLDDDALNKAIIASIGDIDAYQLPDAKGNNFKRSVKRRPCAALERRGFRRGEGRKGGPRPARIRRIAVAPPLSPLFCLRPHASPRPPTAFHE